MLEDLPLTPPVPVWNDLMLKFSSEEAAYEQLLAAGVLTETQALLDADGNVLSPAGYACAANASVDYVGVIYKPTGKTITTDLGEQPEMAQIDGWHVNVRLPIYWKTPSLDEFKVEPVTPSRIWM